MAFELNVELDRSLAETMQNKKEKVDFKKQLKKLPDKEKENLKTVKLNVTILESYKRKFNILKAELGMTSAELLQDMIESYNK